MARGTFVGTSTITRHLPIFEVGPRFPDAVEDAGATLATTYMWMLEEGRASIATIFELLCAADSYPAVVYCAAGKDRTGIVCALILHLIGVPGEAIVAEYTLSDAPAAALRRRRAELAPGRQDLVPAGIWRAPAPAMSSFLEQLEERHGSVEDYLAEIGLDVPSVRTALRGHLVAF